MTADPYAQLGLKKNATAADIKKAYRKLVRESHPDLHPDDAGAEARFKAMTAAHDLLKDPETRARFDAGEIDASGAPTRPERSFYRDHAGPGPQAQGAGDFGDMNDIFAEILRQQGRGRFEEASFAMAGADLRYALEVPFLDAARGTRRRLTLPDGENLEVQIPAGLTDGQTLRLRGKGAPGYRGGPAGDALVTISVAPHPVFQRDGDDIVLTLPVTLDEAVLGAKVMVPTIEGPVGMTVPPGSGSGKTLRLRGRGIVRADGSSGDQRVTLRLAMPGKIDPDLRAFMETWRKTHPQVDPRKAAFGSLYEGNAT